MVHGGDQDANNENTIIVHEGNQDDNEDIDMDVSGVEPLEDYHAVPGLDTTPTITITENCVRKRRYRKNVNVLGLFKEVADEISTMDSPKKRKALCNAVKLTNTPVVTDYEQRYLIETGAGFLNMLKIIFMV